MPFIGGGHLWLVAILLVIVLIVKGPGKLPEVGSGLGRALREFKKATSEAKDEFNSNVPHDVSVAPEASEHRQPAAVSAAVLAAPTTPAQHEAPAAVESVREE